MIIEATVYLIVAPDTPWMIQSIYAHHYVHYLITETQLHLNV